MQGAVIFDLGDDRAGPAAQILLHWVSATEFIERGRGRYVRQLPKGMPLDPTRSGVNRIVLV
jgi:hypothetical protein